MKKSLLISTRLTLLVILLLSVFMMAYTKAVAEPIEPTAQPFATVNGGSLRLDGEHNGLRFSATLSEQPDAAAEYHIMIFPSEYLEESITDGYYEHVTSFIDENNAEYGTNVKLADIICSPVMIGGNYEIRASITDVLFANSARDFTAIAYKLKDGQRTYTAPVTRNLAEVAVLALQSGDYNADPDALEIINEYVTNGMKATLGLGEDDSLPELYIKPQSNIVSFDVSETEKAFSFNITDADGTPYPKLNRFVYATSEDPRFGYSNGKITFDGDEEVYTACTMEFRSPGAVASKVTVEAGEYSVADYKADNTVLDFGSGDNLLDAKYQNLWSCDQEFAVNATAYEDTYTTLYRSGNANAHYYINLDYFKNLLLAGYNELIMNISGYTKVSCVTFEYSINGGTPVQMNWMGNAEAYTIVLNTDFMFDFSSLSEEEISSITSAGIYFSGHYDGLDASWDFKYAKFRKHIDASAYNGENLADEEFAGIWKSDFINVTYDNQSYAHLDLYGTLWQSENNAPTVIYIDNLFAKEIIERGYTEFHVQFNVYSVQLHLKLEFAAQYIFIPGSGTVGNAGDIDYSATSNVDYTVDLTQINTSIINETSGSHFAIYPFNPTDGWLIQWVDISFRKPA